MEKICIVRRRTRAPVVIEGPAPEGKREKATIREMPTIGCSEPEKNSKHHGSQVGNTWAEDNQVIKIQLTPDQCMAVRSKGCLDQLLGGNFGKGDLDLETYEDGRIAFNLHLRLVTGASMLNSREVCRMLQVSRSFLAKNVKNGSIKSYKIGRLRRFLLEDVLNYMSRSNVFGEGLGKVANDTIIGISKEWAGGQPNT